MEKHLCSNNQGNVEATVEISLLEAILHAEGIHSTWKPSDPLTEEGIEVADLPNAKIAYPWNPTAPESESFFAESDRGSILDGFSDSEIESRSTRFFNQIDRLWSAASLPTTLAERFAARVPSVLVAVIAQHAQQVVDQAQKAIASSASIADQLVDCVRELAPGLADDDLYVLARPLAYQMRNGGLQDAINSTVAQVPQVEWQQLSEVQQARLSLAIARYAIAELQPPTKV